MILNKKGVSVDIFYSSKLFPKIYKRKTPMISHRGPSWEKLAIAGAELILRHTVKCFLDVTATTCPSDLVTGLA
jgi:hypothetical protein